jgi:DNA-binding response OmpR family regulator
MTAQNACRVVIVEDHAETAEGLAELLGIWGFESHVAPNGERALDMVDELAPHAVLSDIMLPGIDGYELASIIRHKVGSDVLLIALTGCDDAVDFAAAGFDHRLMKPVDLDALERLLEARRTQ